MLVCLECPNTRTLMALWTATDNAIKVAELWPKMVYVATDTKKKDII